MRDQDEGMHLDEEVIAHQQWNADAEPDCAGQPHRFDPAAQAQARATKNEGQRREKSETRSDPDRLPLALPPLGASPHFGKGLVLVVKEHAEEEPVGEPRSDGGGEERQSDPAPVHRSPSVVRHFPVFPSFSAASTASSAFSRISSWAGWFTYPGFS